MRHAAQRSKFSLTLCLRQEKFGHSAKNAAAMSIFYLATDVFHFSILPVARLDVHSCSGPSHSLPTYQAYRREQNHHIRRNATLPYLDTEENVKQRDCRIGMMCRSNGESDHQEKLRSSP